MIEAGNKSYKLKLSYKKPLLSSPSCGPGKESSQGKMKQEMLSHVSFFLLFFSLCMRVHKIIGTHLVTKVYGGFYKHVLIFFF